MIRLLRLSGRHAKYLLVAGLLMGVALPGLAGMMRPLLPQLVLGLLVMAAVRIGPGQILGSVRALPRTIGAVLVLQLVLPLLITGVAAVAGVAGTPFVAALVLMAAAPSISGSANFAIILGHPPAHALRLLVIGTALAPLTILPVFAALPVFGESGVVIEAALRLFVAIILAVGAGSLIRGVFMPDPAPEIMQAIDGASAILLMVIVVGLMAAVGPALLETPGRAALWLFGVCAANFGLQFAAYRLQGGRAGNPETTVATSIVAGNRNIALFLIALPPEITAPLLVFIGFYQIPMYLTPLVMRRVYS